MVAEDDETSKDKEIDKLMALISLSFKKIYKPTNNNLRTSSNTSRTNQDNSTRINRSAVYENQRIGNVDGARENVEAEKGKGCSLSQGKDAVVEEIDQNDDDNDLAKEQMKDKLFAHQATISILSQQKEAQIKLYKTREDKERDKVIELENKVKVLDSIVYKTGQLVQTINMLNNNCRTSFAKPEFLKKAQRANPHLYDIAPESDEVNRLEKESRSKLSDLIRPFNYDKLNNLYDLFVPQREKSSEQRYFSERSRLSHINVNNRKSKESFKTQTILLEKRMDESILLDKKVILTTSVSRSQLKSNPMGDRVMRNNSQGKKQEVEDLRRNVKLSKNKTSITACNDNLNAKTLNVNSVSAMCSKHMTGNLKLLINFVEKFLGTVKFGNDQIAPILGYGDLVQRAVTIKRVYYIEGLNHNLFSVDQFCDADLEVAFRRSTCFIRDLKGNDLLTGIIVSSMVMASSSLSFELRHHQLAVKE
nr:integrase, catalytic region, zinc finger, CCHC-type, peptidase aspartic, catalytic [Tanacetum cinerariifolium]